MTCLVIKNDGIGDLILASGLISDLTKEYHSVDLVTCIQNREVAEMIPGLRHRIYVSRDSIRFQSHLLRIGVKWKTGDPIDIIAFDSIRYTTYDVAICLRRFIRTSTLILMSMVKAQHRYAAWQYPTNISSTLASHLSIKWNRFNGDIRTLSELEYYKSFLDSFLPHRAWSNPSLSVSDHLSEEREHARIGLAISGSSTNWPESHWVELAKSLYDRGYQLSLFGGQDAVPLARLILAAIPKVRCHVGYLPFSEAAQKLKALTLLIGNDTGFTHYASLFSSRCLIILGGGTFGRFFPWPGSTNQYVIFNALECFDCTWNCPLERRECLHRITAHSVLMYALAIIRDEAPVWLNLAQEDVEYSVAWHFVPGELAKQRLSANGNGVERRTTPLK